MEPIVSEIITEQTNVRRQFFSNWARRTLILVLFQRLRIMFTHKYQRELLHMKSVTGLAFT